MKKFNFKKLFKIISAKQVRGGFSLIEIMTVLFVIALGLVGVLSLMVQNIQSQNVNKGALIAYQLSQEGVELIRRTRDSNWAARTVEPSRTWNYNLAPGHYIMDYRDLAPRSINMSGQTYLKQDSLGYYYNPTVAGDPNPNSLFSRYIDLISNPVNPNSIFVRSTVNWSDHGKSYSYYLETTLYDWK
jgi:prepilin-type N-terminal cleavage/methylation domain-containing protein